MVRRKTKSQAKPKAKAAPRKRSQSPKVHPSVKAATEQVGQLSHAEVTFLENTQNVPAEGNPLQGRPF